MSLSLRRVRCSLRMGIAMIELAALRYRIYKTGMKRAFLVTFSRGRCSFDFMISCAYSILALDLACQQSIGRYSTLGVGNYAGTLRLPLDFRSKRISY